MILPASTPSSSSSFSLSAPPSSPSLSSLPCPGLTDKDSAYIGQYFTQTSVASTGGEDLHSLARPLFLDEFKNLPSNKKGLVWQKQQQTHSWSVNHLMKTIHTIRKSPCKGNAEVAHDGSVMACNVMACKSCQALLASYAFKKAISRKPAPNKNCAFTPHVYQPPVIGKMYNLSFNDLIDGVSARLDSQMYRQLISACRHPITVRLCLDLCIKSLQGILMTSLYSWILSRFLQLKQSITSMGMASKI